MTGYQPEIHYETLREEPFDFAFSRKPLGRK
jgi:hypothetical protein